MVHPTDEPGLLDDLVERGRFAEAEVMAQRLAGVPQHHGRALTALARCAIARRDYDEALRWVDRAARVTEGDTSLSALRGVLLLASGRAKEAVACLDPSWADLPGVSPGVALGQALVSVGEPGRAASVVARLLRRHPLSRGSGLAAVADQIVADDRAVGWIGCDEEGMLVGALRGSALGGGIVSIREGGASSPPVLQLPAADFIRRYQVSGPGGGLERFRLPVPPRAGGWELFADVNQAPLLGAPLRLPVPADVEGIAELDGTILRGWAWMPSESSKHLEVTVRDGAGRVLRVVADRVPDGPMPPGAGEGRHGFLLDLEKAGAVPGMLAVSAGPGETALVGSPVRWAGGMSAAVALPLVQAWLARPDGAPRLPNADAVIRALQAIPIPVGPIRRRPVSAAAPAAGIDVIIPVYRGHGETMACLRSVLDTVGGPAVRVVVVNDASPEPALVRDLEAAAAAGRIVLVHNRTNLGFPASVNVGMSAGPGRDVVLLNSDTLVAGDWLGRLHRAAYGAHDVGTVTPLSNDAEILSYPSVRGARDTVPDRAATAQTDRFAAQANAGMTVDIPTAVGFCMYIRRACLTETGLFDTENFGRGYGEENDFCMRARRLGWRHVAAADVFVAHVGGRSFGRDKKLLQARNQRILERMHPGYEKLVADFIDGDPLADARRRIDLLRRSAAEASAPPAATLFVTLGLEGGVARHVEGRGDAVTRAGGRALFLRPAPGKAGACLLEDSHLPGLRDTMFGLEREFDALIAVLARARVRSVEFHHTLGHDPRVLDIPERLGIPYDVVIHDYGWICPRIALTGRDGRYCGEPDEAACELCVYENGTATGEDITVARLRSRSAALFSKARRVVAPARDVAARFSRYVGETPIAVEPWDDAAAPAPRGPVPMRNGRWRVCLVGAIGRHKGYQVLLDCARNAALRRLPLEFVVVGYTEDDHALFATGRVFVTGRYEEDEAVALIQAQKPDIAFFPSLCPETWCYALSAAWRAGLDTIGFDLGAVGERIRSTGRGLVLPPLLQPEAINDALLSFLTGHRT